MTKTQARALARKARRIYGHVRTSSETIEFPCPLDVNQHRQAHCVIVWHKVWESPSAASIDAAFVEHYTTPYDEERCPHVSVQAGDR